MIVDKSAFVHIPRTGGRFICSLLIENYPTTLYDWNEFVNFNGTSIEKNHQPASFYTDIENKFTVVRNPYHRFLSILKEMLLQGLEIKENYEIDSILDFIDNGDPKKKMIYRGWLLQQCKFIDKNTKIWFFEDGVNSEKFYDWMKEVVGLPIKNRVDEINKEFFLPVNPNFGFVLSEKMKSLVKEIYYEDFKTFSYGFSF